MLCPRTPLENGLAYREISKKIFYNFLPPDWSPPHTVWHTVCAPLVQLQTTTWQGIRLGCYTVCFILVHDPINEKLVPFSICPLPVWMDDELHITALKQCIWLSLLKKREGKSQGHNIAGAQTGSGSILHLLKFIRRSNSLELDKWQGPLVQYGFPAFLLPLL